MRAIILLMLSAAVVLPNSCSAPVVPVATSGLTSGKVTITAVSLLDATRIPATVELTEQNRKQQIHITAGTPADVPLGAYTVRVLAPNHAREQFELEVRQPEIAIRVPLHESGGMACLTSERLSSVAGALKPGISGRDLWVKLIPIAGNGGREAKVSPMGFFLFDGVEHGRYVLLVMEKATVLLTEVVEVSRDVNLKLNLDQR